MKGTVSGSGSVTLMEWTLGRTYDVHIREEEEPRDYEQEDESQRLTYEGEVWLGWAFVEESGLHLFMDEKGRRVVWRDEDILSRS